MIATHNIKMNGRWYAAGENIPAEVPETKPETSAEEVQAVAEEPEKEQAKPKTSSRRKKISE